MAHSTYHFPKKTIRDISVHGKRVLLRADFNVPMDDGAITSDYRITQTLPTIQYLLERSCEVIIVSHLGRPDGVKNASFSLGPVAKRLQELLGQPVQLLPDCIGDGVRQALKRPQPKRVTLLENVRFYPGEETNDPEFAAALIAVTKPDYVVQDGFGVVHRAHASTEGISHLVPAVAGLLLEAEVSTLSGAMEDPHRPLVAVLGGAKIADKLPLVERFLQTADTVLIGGAMANNFLADEGHPVGKSLLDPEGGPLVKQITKTAKVGQLVLPSDVAVGKSTGETATRSDVGLDAVAPDDYILDLGFETMHTFTDAIKTAGTVIWNGTLGLAELPAFAQSSEVLAQALAQQHGITSIIGGGDTADFVLDWQKTHSGQFTHISTGGGASLELLSGKKLPGVEALLGH